MAPLPFDVRRSKSSLLKLPNDHSPHHNQSCSVAVGPKKYGPAGLQIFFYWVGVGRKEFFNQFCFQEFYCEIRHGHVHFS